MVGLRRIGGVLALALASGLSGCSGGGGGGGNVSVPEGTPEWEHARGDAGNRARSAVVGTADGSVSWSRPVDGAATGAVTIGPFGSLRVKPAGRDLLCLDKSGGLEWSIDVGPGARAPLIDVRGNTYVGSDENVVVKVDRAGELVWSRPVGATPRDLSFFNRFVVVPLSSGEVRFYETNGDLAFSVGVGALGATQVVQVLNSQLFLSSPDGNLYELRIDLASKAPSNGAAIAYGGVASRSTPVSDGQSVFVVTDDERLVKVFKERFGDDPAEIDWVFDPESDTTSGGASSPALGRNGRFYYGTEDGRMLAVGPDGKLVWEREVGAPVRSSPILDLADNLYFRTADGVLHSLSASGEPRFRRERVDPGGALDPSPTMDVDGNVYIGTHRGEVLCLGSAPVAGQIGHDARHSGGYGPENPEENGLAWSIELPPPQQAPLVLGDGTIAVLDRDGTLHRISPSGAREGTVVFGGFADAVAVGRDGRFYATTSDGRLLVHLRGGGLLRSTPVIASGILSAPSLGPDGTVHVASSTGVLARFDLGGNELARSSIPPSRVPPAVRPDGGRLIASSQAVLVDVDAAGAERFRFALPGAVTRSPVVLDDEGRAFVLTDDDVLVAVDEDGAGLWMFDAFEGGIDAGRGGPLLGANGELVLASRQGVLHARDPETGAAIFRLELGQPVASPPVRGSGGRFAVAGANGDVFLVSAGGSLLRTVPGAALDGAGLSVSPIPVGDRGLVVHSESGRLSRIEDGVRWSSFHGRPDHRGRSTVAGPSRLDVQWSLDVGEQAELSPILAANGDVLLHTDQSLVVVDPAGSLRHRASAGAGPGLPVGLRGGRRVSGSSSGALTGFDPDGGSAWVEFLGGAISGLNVDASGQVLALSQGRLYAYDADGEAQWSRELGPVGEAAPAVGADGVLRVATTAGELVLFDLEDRVVRGRTTLPGAVSRCSPTIGAEGSCYVVTDADVLVAVDAAGAIRWTFDPGSGTSLGGRSAPALFADGSVLFGAMDGQVYRVDPEGNEVYRFDTGGAVQSAAVIDATGSVFVGSDSGTLFAISPAGNQIDALDPSGFGSPLGSVALSRDGALYVATRPGVLYRVQ